MKNKDQKLVNNNDWNKHFSETQRSASLFHKWKVGLALFLLLQSASPSAVSYNNDLLKNNSIELTQVLEEDGTEELKKKSLNKTTHLQYSSLFGKEDHELTEHEKYAKNVFVADIANQIDAIKWTNDLPLKNITFSNQTLAKKYGFPRSVEFSFKNSKETNGKVQFLVNKNLAQDPLFLQNSKANSFQVLGAKIQKIKDPVFEITIWERKFLVKSAIPSVTLEGIKMVKNPATQKLEIHMPVKAIWLFAWTIKRDWEKRWIDIYNCYYWVPFWWEKMIWNGTVKIIDISR